MARERSSTGMCALRRRGLGRRPRREALDAGLDLLGDLSSAGRRWANALDEGLHETLHAIFAVADAARSILLSTPTGRLLQDFVAGGAAFLGWFGRECDDNAPPANGAGGSGNVVVAVGGIDSHREAGDDGSFASPARTARLRAFGALLVLVPPGVHRLLEGGHLRRSAPQGSDARGAARSAAAREQPGRTFDLMGHSQGGVVVALFLAEDYRGHEDEYPPIENVVTFASPLRGTPLGTTGEHLGRNPIGRAVMRRARCDRPPDPRADRHLDPSARRGLRRDQDDHGRRASRRGSTSRRSPAVEDWDVPVRSTELDGAQSQAIALGERLDAHSAITTAPPSAHGRASGDRAPVPAVHVVRGGAEGLGRLDAAVTSGALRRAARPVTPGPAGPLRGA